MDFLKKLLGNKNIKNKMNRFFCGIGQSELLNNTIKISDYPFEPSGIYPSNEIQAKEIGARNSDENGNDSGHARIFDEVGGVWTQLGSDIAGENAEDHAGARAAMSSDGTRVANRRDAP